MQKNNLFAGKNGVFQSFALAEMIRNSPATESAGFSTLYEHAEKQPTVIPTDQPLPASGQLSESDVSGKFVLSHLSGEDTDTCAESTFILSEEKNDPVFREYHLRIIRNAMYELLEDSLFNTGAYLTASKKFNCALSLIIPEDFAKLGVDFLHYYHAETKETNRLFKKTKTPKNKEITIIVHPEWINEEWLYWKSRNAEEFAGTDDPEPSKISMYYDLDANTAFLLGARTFGEIRRAVSTISSHLAVVNDHGLPLHGTIKHIKATKNKKSRTGTFLTASMFDTDKTFIGLSDHADYLNKNDSVTFGSGGSLLLVTDQPGKKQGAVAMNEGMQINAGDLPADMAGSAPLLSGENALVTTKNRKKRLMFEHVEYLRAKTILSPAAFKTGGKKRNLDLPDYISLCSRDELMPPLVAIKDAKLTVAMYMSFFTRALSDDEFVFIPGANPDRVWHVTREIPIINKLIRKTRFKLLLINTGVFFKNAASRREISPEVLSALYPRILRGDVRWKEWSECPGLMLPQKGSFKTAVKGYDDHFHPSAVASKDHDHYYGLLLHRMQQRLDVLENLCVPAEYRTGLHRIVMSLSKLV